MKRLTNLMLLVAVAGALLGVAGPVQASTVFEATWSGAALGNTATADALLTIDTTMLGNPSNGQEVYPVPGPISAISMTVTGASSGNGTFVTGDFASMYWNTGGGVLDFTHELVGQSIPNGTGTWATDHSGNGGDFNLFSSNDVAPNGTFYFELTTADGFGDTMYLTSLAPLSSVPEPSSLVLGVSGSLIALSVGCFRRRRRRALTA